MYGYDQISRESDTTSIPARDQFQGGCDPEFDAVLDELELEFASLRHASAE
jgi:hypothetical protein